MPLTASSFGCSGQPYQGASKQTTLAEPQVPPKGLQPQRFNFRMLPGELRLQVLRSTHLGPPESAHYESYFEKMTVRDGRLIIERFNGVDQELDPCPFRSWHRSGAPRCQCRILPLALFLVDRQMYREASGVFYSHAFFDFYGDRFGAALDILRRVPVHSLWRLQRMQFTMTVAQCDGWGDGALASGYPEHSYRDIAQWYWDGGPRPIFDYQADWRAVVLFLRDNVDLTRVSLTIDMATCGWSFIEINEMLVWEDLDFAWFRFIYDFNLGVATTICSLKGLAAVDFKLYPFSNLKPWLEREVIGRRNGYGNLPKPSRRGYGNHIPRWHNMDRRLEGSNYYSSI